jgi:GT2 family glycosyltransferase
VATFVSRALNWARTKIRNEPRTSGWRRRVSSKIAVAAIEVPIARLLRGIPRPGPAYMPHQALAPLPPAALVDAANLPTISIVTPSYQQGRFLEWTIRSVLLQAYPKLQYVVMDGGSTDETRDILKRYERFFTHVESAADGGQADAVARGFTHTDGEIMAYLNSDDLLAPGSLEFVARYFAAHSDVDAIYSHRVFINEDNTVDSYWILPAHRDWIMKRWDYIPQETCFWRRRLYEECGAINPSFQFALDYDLFVRFMERGRMQRVNRFLGAFRKYPGSKTSGLVEGVTHPEVVRVRREYAIKLGDWHRLPELALYECIDIRSRQWAAGQSTLPGALAGVGYDYDAVWQGRLYDPSPPKIPGELSF